MKVNGHRNRETWIVWASISNDPALFESCLAMAARYPKPARLAFRLNQRFTIVQAGGVDWDNIAKMLLEYKND